MPVVTIKGKNTHLKYPANQDKMSPKQKKMYIMRMKAKKIKKKPKKKRNQLIKLQFLKSWKS